jgi:hypothetical protein
MIVKLPNRGGLIVSLLTVSILVSGCTPIWPHLKADKDVENCKEAPGQPDQINYGCIRDSIAELQEMQQRTGDYDRGLGYTAVAGGTYAAYLSSLTHPNKSLLKHTAIGLGALIGFNQVVGADKQQDILAAGITALRCVEKAAYAIDFAQKNASNPLDVQTLVDRSKVAASIRYRAISDATWRSVESSIAPMISAQTTMLFHSNLKLNNAVNTAKQSAGIDVYEATSSIRDNIRTQIVTNKPNLQQIFSDQQKQTSGLLSSIISADNDKKQNKSQLESLVGFKVDDPSGGTNPAKPAQDAFSSCVTPTVPQTNP